MQAGKLFDAKLMPAPRLELVWSKTKDPKWNWHCTYNLVMVLTPYDIRHTKRNEYRGVYAEKKIKLSTTRVGNQRETMIYPEGRIDTPFRDGAHISWDAAQLKLPCYVVCDGKAQALYSSEKEELLKK